MSIEANPIAFNRYAPAGKAAINLYSTDTAENLTVSQIVAAVCIRAAGAFEDQSVNKMNIMNGNTDKLAKASDYMRQIADKTLSDWAAARSYLEETVGVAGLPDDIDTYERRMVAVNAVKERLDVLTQQAQEDMIDMQTLINRRDMAFNTSSNIVKAVGNAKLNTASKMI
jgi:hypothetical protein